MFIRAINDPKFWYSEWLKNPQKLVMVINNSSLSRNGTSLKTT